MAEVASSVAYDQGQVMDALDEDYEDLKKNSTMLRRALPVCKAASSVESALSPASLVARLPSSFVMWLAQLPSFVVVAGVSALCLFIVPGARVMLVRPLGPAVVFAACTAAFAFLVCSMASAASAVFALAELRGVPTGRDVLIVSDLARVLASFDIFYFIACSALLGMTVSVFVAEVRCSASWRDYAVCALKAIMCAAVPASTVMHLSRSARVPAAALNFLAFSTIVIALFFRLLEGKGGADEDSVLRVPTAAALLRAAAASCAAAQRARRWPRDRPRAQRRARR